MRVGLLRTQVPFVTGGAERLAANLCRALEQYGHQATEITLPFKWYPGEVLADHILAAKLTDVSEVEGVPIDRMIGLKFPAYLAHHPNMQFWITHQHRQAYDQWAAGTSALLEDPDGMALRDLIRAEDKARFEATSEPIYTISQNVTQRLQDHLGIASAPIYHPPPQAEQIKQGAYGDYLFAPGRINPSKRLELILEALAATRSKMRLVVAGTAENPDYAEKLYQRSCRPDLAGRVDWLGPVDDATLRRFYAEARAVVFVPQDEDYGYITLEAMLAAKPLITVTDAGGPLEFVTNEEEGLITAPDPAALAGAFGRLMDDANLAERFGQSGFRKYHEMKVSWEEVVERLVGPGMPGAGGHVPASQDAASEAGAEVHIDPVAQLRDAIAPLETDLPFTSVQQLLEKYVFEELPAELGEPEPPINTGIAGYFETHWKRYLTTLAALEGLTPKRALDVGVFPPLIFQAMLSEIYPGIEMAGLWEGPEPYAQQIRYRETKKTAFSIRLEPANGERDQWPFADESFDLITGMEILEHLALDPYHFYSEANRVLRPGGHLLLTTPNVASHRGVWKLIGAEAPYSFGIFVPSGGVYGRHNREYAPRELAELGKAAGFETLRLSTHDVYGNDMTPEVAELLVSRGDDLSMRGENILYLARKIGSPKGLPTRFYHGDPSLMIGTLTPGVRDLETGLLPLRIENRSKGLWCTSGTRSTCLLAEWIDADGVLRHQRHIQPLPAPLPAGGSTEVLLSLDQQEAEPDGILRLHLYQAGTGVFSGRGRAAPVEVPCSRAGFHRLIRNVPSQDQGG